MGCKYSKVISHSKQEERAKSVRRQKSNKLGGSVVNAQDLSTEEILDDLYSKGFIKNPKKRVGGVAFDIGATGLPKKPPRRLEKIKRITENDMYTAEEKALMAEMVRDDDARKKGLKRDLKHDKAKSRRLLKETEIKAKVENKRKKYDQRMDEMDKRMAQKM